MKCVHVVHGSQSHGTTLDGTRVAPNKPVQLQDGARLAFGTSPAATHIVRCESSGTVRDPLQVARGLQLGWMP